MTEDLIPRNTLVYSNTSEMYEAIVRARESRKGIRRLKRDIEIGDKIAEASTIAEFNLEAAQAQQRLKQEWANEIVGELGMKAKGAPKNITGRLDSSPLFGGNPQTDLFEKS